MYIKKVTEELTDHSKVYNVHLEGDNGTIDIACLNEDSADSFIDEISQVVKRFTVEDAIIIN